MTAGARDTLIVFEQRQTTQDPAYGMTVEGDWTEHGQAWAKVQDILPSQAESVGDSISMTRRPCDIEVDYFDGEGVTSAMRIDIDGRKLRIVSGPAMLNGRKGWRMRAEELSSSGEEA